MVPTAKLGWFRRKNADCSRALSPAPFSDSSISPSDQPPNTENEIQIACVSQKVEGEGIDEESGKLITKLQHEREQLAADLGTARAAAEESCARSRDLEAQLARLRASLEEETREHHAKAARIEKLEAALEAARDAGARRAEERARFHYVLAHNGQTGSVSRTVLASDPDSLLYTMYCGDWEYPRDEK